MDHDGVVGKIGLRVPAVREERFQDGTFGATGDEDQVHRMPCQGCLVEKVLIVKVMVYEQPHTS